MIRQGRDLPLKGAAEKDIVQLPFPSRIAVQPIDFRGLRPRLLVKEGDAVHVGTSVVCDKTNPDIVLVSPVSGNVRAIIRGEKRVFERIIIATDSKQTGVEFDKVALDKIHTLNKEQVIRRIMKGGLWPVIRQRPFSNIADPNISPKAVFIQAMNTEPLALDVDFILNGKEALFQAGINILKHLTDGPIHLCFSDKAESKALRGAVNVEKHTFAGPHPAGNVSTHIHYIDPIKKGENVWYIHARDVVRIAFLFIQGRYPADVIVARTGEGITQRNYASTIQGVCFSDLLKGETFTPTRRYISGSVLSGRNAGTDGFLGFYDTQVTVIPEGGKRRFLGWLFPEKGTYSFSKAFLSSFTSFSKTYSLDTDAHGSQRTIVLNDVYDSLVPLDIMTFFLIRAVLAGDIEEAERLGILECDEEDFTLCSFACPSKIDVGRIIRQGLDMIEKEG